MRGDLLYRVWLAAGLSVIAQSSMADVTPSPSVSLSTAAAPISSYSLSHADAVLVEPATVLSLADAQRYAASFPRVEQQVLRARQQLRQSAVLGSQQRPNPTLDVELNGLRRMDAQDSSQRFAISQQVDVFKARPAQQRLTQLQLEAEQFH